MEKTRQSTCYHEKKKGCFLLLLVSYLGSVIDFLLILDDLT